MIDKANGCHDVDKLTNGFIVFGPPRAPCLRKVAGGGVRRTCTENHSHD